MENFFFQCHMLNEKITIYRLIFALSYGQNAPKAFPLVCLSENVIIKFCRNLVNNTNLSEFESHRDPLLSTPFLCPNQWSYVESLVVGSSEYISSSKRLYSEEDKSPFRTVRRNSGKFLFTYLILISSQIWRKETIKNI